MFQPIWVISKRTLKGSLKVIIITVLPDIIKLLLVANMMYVDVLPPVVICIEVCTGLTFCVSCISAIVT